ncbi:hypothetical protein Lesp02_10120 [Lentzea sp. NBRC 105346]|uniref:hypothetical protein n=1 Tax=Lentzea sp. NBRC 105346 TaxID=3032205 RepID=UPI0024A213B0|nr:hypothetical protein [Lentzea sp. NBRC 105346]GLZ28822.1 hypothetical protein Lesp02_10120 [Lentzea sp. NBRC 105346]
MSVSSDFPQVVGKSRVLLEALLDGEKSTAELASLLGTRHVATYVLRLRKALGSPELVHTTFTGYRLELPARPTPVFQLPAPVGSFVGRLGELSRILSATGPVVISGPPGIGKTALAITAGHALASDYPDGQLYADLRGYSPEPPLAPSVVLSRFLRALGVHPDRMPMTEEALAREFRALVRDTRMLVVLDNAASDDQVRPLLPGGRCGVLITSRADLPSFTGVRLGTLHPDEAASLVHGDTELAEWCGYYPLALRIALGNLIGRPDVESYVDELRTDRLDALAVDGDAGVRRAFDLSYATLGPDEARLFGLLSVVPGDFSVHAAMALLEVDHPAASASLDRLVSANLVHRSGDRFVLHDLLRDYAAEKASAEAAGARLLRWYMAATQTAARIVYPELSTSPVPPSAAVPDLPDTDAALAWLTAERQNIIAAIHRFTADGPAELTPHLVDTVGGLFGAYGHTAEYFAAADAALRAAHASGNTEAEGAMLVMLGGAHHNRGELRRALELFRAADDLGATARSPWLLGFRCVLELELGDLAAARATNEHGHEVAAAWPDVPFLEAGPLLGEGTLARLTGDVATAVAQLRAALRRVESHGLDNMRTAVLLELGRCLPPAEAIPVLRDAVATATSLEVTRFHAEALAELAVAECAAGDIATARDTVTRALDLVAAMGDTPRVESTVHHAHGAVLTAMAAHDEAHAAFTLALDRALTAESPYDAMRAHIGLGDADSARTLADRHGFALA